MSKGLIRSKYHVQKVNDPDHKHDACEFFVLDPLHDSAARDALFAYALVCESEELSDDIFEWLEKLNAGKD